MSQRYQVSVDQKHTFDLTESEMQDLAIIATKPNHYHVLNEQKSVDVSIKSSDFLQKKYTISVNNTDHEVEISDALSILIKDLGFNLSASKTINEIKAPMPGLILEIAVSVGQEVQENDLLIILEAMKMENSFQSPRAGVIKSIAVSKGDAVEKGQLLIDFE
uniref:acetyl-CoA carboxylase biotin carboxyl carrier protein subunit n=2 Tax=Flavobacterium sp. TaxID=239 RepID=UPI00404B414C